MVQQEIDSTFSKMVDPFKNHYSSWECVSAIMTDKDVTERSADSIR